jgi:peroxiredoxin
MTKLTTSVLAGILSVVFLSSCASDASDQQQAEQRKAPDFEVTTIDGVTVSLQESLDNDKPVVVYFTASWCPVCAQNWPVLSEVYPEYEDDLTLIAIGIDPTDDMEVMRNLAEEKGFKFPITKGHPEIMLDFGVESQATTVGVNREGFIEFQKNKTALSAEEYRELFDSLVMN